MQELRGNKTDTTQRVAPVGLVPGAFEMSSTKCPWCGQVIEQGLDDDRAGMVSVLDLLQHHMWGMHTENWKAMVREAVRREIQKEKTDANAS